MIKYFQILIFSLLLFSGISVTNGEEIEKSVAAIRSAPDWRTLSFPNQNKEAEILLKTLLSCVKHSPEEIREIIKILISTEQSVNLEVGGKIYILNRLYCNVPPQTDRDGWEIFGGWGGIGVDENTINSLYPLVIRDKKFDLEQFSGYGGPPYQALEEFDWLIKRFGRRFKVKDPNNGK